MIHLNNYLTVTALTKYIKAKLEGDKHLFSLMIKGEISNFKKHSKGHLYFTIKDENAQISALMFSRDASRLLFSPKQGDKVLVTGKLSLYEPSGTYSIQVSSMKLDGIGELYLKFEKLKKELEEKGYFKKEHKICVPKFPKIIGVVTSPTGAVIQDIKNTISRRYLLAELHLYPALAQGPQSAKSISEQIIKANEKNEVDVLIIGRGGGSIEDLWGFNEMVVVQAIYDSKIPIVSAVGHETDYTLSDFVSDLRAPTPTAAAELVTPNKIDLLKRIDDDVNQIEYRMNQHLEKRKTALLHIDQRLEQLSPNVKLEKLSLELRRNTNNLLKTYIYQLETKNNKLERLTKDLKNPLHLVASLKNRKDILDARLQHNIESIFNNKNYRFHLLKTSLSALNPLVMMDKGFAVLSKGDELVTSVRSLELEDQVSIKFRDGIIGAKINRKQEK